MVEGREKGEVAEWFRLKECPGCGYSLVGLMEEGVCPECGRGYDQKVVVVSGRGRGRWDGVAGGTWRGFVEYGVYMFVLAVMLLWGARDMYSRMNLLTWGLAGALVVGTGMYARFFGSRQPVMQLWMSEKGVGQTVATAEGRVMAWVGRNIYWLIFPALMMLPWMDYLGGSGRTMEIIWGIYGVLGVVWWMMRGKGLGGKKFVPVMWGWGEVEEVRVEGLTRGRMRIRCYVPRYRGNSMHWGKIVVKREWAVDIEVACSAEVVQGVRGVMERWRVEGKGKR